MAIICGDWNLIIYPELDCENYKHVNNYKSRAVVEDLLDELEFTDAYRLINEEKKVSHGENLTPKKNKPDWIFFWINFDVIVHLDDCQIMPGYRTDHSGVILK